MLPWQILRRLAAWCCPSRQQLRKSNTRVRSRHTTASLATNTGANVKVVQRLVGHATAAMTHHRCGHLLSDDRAGVADASGKAIEGVAYHSGIQNSVTMKRS
jgi:hypothetical protein